MQNLNEILLRNYCKEKASVVTYFLPHTHTHTHTYIYIYIYIIKLIKNIRGHTWRKPRIFSKISGEEDQDDKWKRWRTKMYKIGKIDHPILTNKRPY
jgi:hypothetical protein